MSIATTDNKATYQGNGVTTSWPFTFPVLEEGHLSVILTDPDGLETTLTSDYVVDLTNKVVTYPGYLAGQEPPVESQPPVLPSGSHITLLRVVPYTQDTDLGDRWPFNVIEVVLDRTTMQLQQLAEESSRSVKTSVSSTVTPDELLAEIRTGAATASTAASTATGAASTATTAAATATAAASAASTDAATASTAASTATGAASTATTAAATATAAASAASADAATASTAASTATGAASTATTGAATATTKAGEAAESAAIALANSGAVLLPDHVIEGGKITSVAGFDLAHGAVSALIAGKHVAVAAGDVQTLTARKAALLTIDKNGVRGKVECVSPTALIDNNTVGMWVFNQPAGSPVPNSAVGLSSIAVANDLTPTGTMTRVDGRFDYAIKPNGTSAYFQGANLTNFPSGANAKAFVRFALRCNSIDGGYRYLVAFGAASTSTAILLYRVDATLFIDFYGSQANTGYKFEVGRDYIIDFGLESGAYFIRVNGETVFTGNANPTIGTTFFRVFTSAEINYFGADTMYFVEIKNAVPSVESMNGAVSKLLFPICYDCYNGVYPSLSEVRHEYRFDEASGTAVADSYTTAPINGTAVGTTIVPSFDGLSYARYFDGVDDKINLGAFAFAATFTVLAVCEVAKGKQLHLLSNRDAGNTVGYAIHVNSDGTLSLDTTVRMSNPSIVPNNVPICVMLTFNNGELALYSGGIGNKTQFSGVSVRTTSGTGVIGNDIPYGTFGCGKIDYLLYVPRVLSENELQRAYDLLMTRSRKNITHQLPADTISLGYAYAGSSGIDEFNDSDWGYGRREKSVNGNRRVFLGWKYFSGGAILSWNNPFGSRKVRLKYSFAQNAEGMNESDTYSYFYTSADFGIRTWPSTANAIRAQVYGAVLNGVSVTSGYIGCYAEVLEDD